ncbi:hypothetical protein Taro_024357 [Colocasia esculenta]|uniref:Uncharacterized protein n=1 Tax=Colocasia esculenta TaxID=4460 RepID=A0A843V653_COLES|nr:hypothetical protein [Colocasia esculenta]
MSALDSLGGVKEKRVPRIVQSRPVACGWRNILQSVSLECAHCSGVRGSQVSNFAVCSAVAGCRGSGAVLMKLFLREAAAGVPRHFLSTLP